MGGNLHKNEIMGAIAAAVIAAGATVYSVQAQKKAAEKAASAGGSGADIYGRSTDMPSYMPVDQTVFDPAADKNRYINQMLPASIDAAKRSTNYGIKQRERLMPGFKSIMAGAGGTLSRWMAGDVPDDVKDSVMRSIAEKSGGTAGAGTGYKDDFARSIGKIGAIDLPGQALQLGPTWMKLADSFVTKPEEAFGSIMDFIKAKYGYAASSDALKVHQAESIYTSEVNKERSDAMPTPQAS